MADFFLNYGIEDLTLGKPGIYGLPSDSTVRDALSALRDLNLTEITVWESLGHSFHRREGKDCRYLGRVTLLDIISYYVNTEADIEGASSESVSVLLNKSHGVQHVDLSTRLVDAFNFVLDGTQCFLVPLDNRCSKYSSGRKLTTGDKYRRMDYCWLTQEDMLRFMLGYIGVFSPLPMQTIEELGIINPDVLSIDVNANAIDALPLMLQASETMSAVAVLEDDHNLVADISLSSLRNCDETAALAVANLSVGDFVTYIQDVAGASQWLKEQVLYKKASIMEGDSDDSISESSENDTWESSSSSSESETLTYRRSKPLLRSNSSDNSIPLLTCHPWSSLVAVMAQALAHRTMYLWVTDNDNTLLGIVTYVDMIRVLCSPLFE